MIHHNFCNSGNIGYFMVVTIYFIDSNTHENVLNYLIMYLFNLVYSVYII